MAFFHHHHDGPPGGRGASGGSHLPLPAESSTEFKVLDKAKVQFTREGTRLRIKCEGADEWREVTLFRLFPLSEPDNWISVVDKDGKEVGIIERVHDLDHTTQELIRAELQRRYTVPRILRIRACKSRADVVEWEVDTDRGPRTFHTRSIRDNVLEPEPGRYLLTDLDGNRYDVPDIEALDARSRVMLERHL